MRVICIVLTGSSLRTTKLSHTEHLCSLELQVLLLSIQVVALGGWEWWVGGWGGGHLIIHNDRIKVVFSAMEVLILSRRLKHISDALRFGANPGRG